MTERKFTEDQLKELAARLLRTSGMKAEDAATIAKDLVAADMRGLYSHGVSRIPMYLKRIECKCVKPVPDIKVEQVGAAVLRVNGDDSMGFLVAHKAMEEGMKLAESPMKDHPLTPMRKSRIGAAFEKGQIHPSAAVGYQRPGSYPRRKLLHCYQRTDRMVPCAGRRQHPSERLQVLNGTQTADTLWNEVRTYNEPVLVYSYETPEGLQAKRNEEGRKLSALIEQTLSGLAAKAAAEGVTRIIVAGGETSGAVTKKLGYEAFQIGESIAPGVPILLPLDAPAVRLVLKSGNFGQEDFFIHSTYATLWSCLPHENPQDCVPDYTPYLKMKLGTVGIVPYAKPGSQENGRFQHLGFQVISVDAVLEKARPFGAVPVPGKGRHWFMLPNGIKFELKEQ